MNKLYILSMLTLLGAACAWEDEETLYPPEVCDTLNVSYSQDVIPIFANNCYTCHSNSNAPDFAQGIAFEDYEDASAYGSTIVGAINHFEGFPAMPKGEEKLDTCSIITIEAWVNSGAPDN